MRKNFVLYTIAVLLGIALAIVGREWIGWVIALCGLAKLGIEWRFRDLPPIDPVLLADVDRMVELEKSDPAAADKLFDRAMGDADRREERELADLRRRAVSDRRAAKELRNRLRGKLKNWQGARRKAEKYAMNSPDGDAVLKEIDRATSDTEQQLAQAELYLENFRTE
jgi:hypothetical protein